MVSEPLPSSLEAEEAVLGAMLAGLKPTTWALDTGLQAAHFSRGSHRTLFDTIVKEANIGAVDHLIVLEALKASGKLSEVGGAVAVLTLSERVPAVANVKHYAREVMRYASLRSMVSAGHEISQLGYEGKGDTVELLSKALEIAAGITSGSDDDGGVTASEVVAEFRRQGEAERPRYSWMWGFEEFDRVTGGYFPSEINLIGAYSGEGKSWLAVQMIEMAVGAGASVGLFNMEMSSQSTLHRLLAMGGGQSLHRISTGLAKYPTVEDRARTVAEWPVRFYEGATDIHRIVRAQRKHKFDVLVIDHFHLLQVSGKDYRIGLNEACTQLKAIANTTGCAVLALVQLNRGETKDSVAPPRPKLASIRETTALEQIADNVLFLYRDRDEGGRPTDRGYLYFRKKRNGAMPDDIRVQFDPVSHRWVQEQYRAGLGAVS